MFAETYGAATVGVNGVLIEVEVDLSNGLPSFDIVGLPDAAVRESKERVRAAIKNAGYKLQPHKLTINLAPADMKKDGSGLDLPIAAGILAANNIIPEEKCRRCAFIAELSLEGKLRPIHGILPMVIECKERGIENIFVSPANANEALLVEKINVYAPPDLKTVIGFLREEVELERAKADFAENEGREMEYFSEDFADVQGQFMVKRALEIAAAGGHNVLLFGSPGAGKTMLARRLPSILPAMTPQESLEVTKIYSISGKLRQRGGLITARPFRAPHSNSSAAAMIGGGSNPKPGEVTLSHNGVLFLDEMPEYSRNCLESLRQPLEDGVVSIARVNATLSYPSSFLLVAAMNPCPCGFYYDAVQPCSCTPSEIKRYLKKISGPLLDRIDIHVQVPRLEYKDLVGGERGEPSEAIRRRVEAARRIQIERLKKHKLVCNAQMSHSQIKSLCKMTRAAEKVLESVFKAMNLSARSYDRCIKVARSIADLAGSEAIEEAHIAEAVQLRGNKSLE